MLVADDIAVSDFKSVIDICLSLLTVKTCLALFEVNTMQYFCQNGYMSYIADALGQSLALIVAPLSHSLFGQWYWYQGVDIVKIACQLHLASHVSSKVFADVWPIAIFQLIDNLSQFGMWFKEE